MTKMAALGNALAATSLSGAADAAAIVRLFNTGVDAAGNSTTTHTSGAYLTDPDTVFIVPLANGQGGSTTYTLTFDLGGPEACTAQRCGSFAADSGASVFLNGNLLANNRGPVSGTFGSFQPLTDATAGSSASVSGVDTLTFDATDDGQPTGLLVTGLAGCRRPGP